MPNEKESCCTPIEEKCVVFYAFGRYRVKKKKGINLRIIYTYYYNDEHASYVQSCI